MDFSTLLLFSAAVIPLVCTPGPDILFIASQALGAGTAAGLRATAGVVLGYGVHSLLVALGLAALVAASPVLFEIIRWIGIAYLLYLAYLLGRSSLRAGALEAAAPQARRPLRKGLLTSLLNPKGMMVYLAILPQFMDPQSGDSTLQAVLLSAVFMAWCTVIYSLVGIGLGRLGAQGLSSARRRLVDGTAGALILLAAGFMALMQR